MRILLSEFAFSTGLSGTYLLEGRAMLDTLASSFLRLGHEVCYTSSGPSIKGAEKVNCTAESLESVLRTQALQCDAGLVIAPEEDLARLSAIIEDNTLNLGSCPEAVERCADKLVCTKLLREACVRVPRTLETGTIPENDWVIKPRCGCASEDTYFSRGGNIPQGHIATEFIPGESLSVSLICGKRTLPLTVNKQLVEMDPGRNNSPVEYRGSLSPYETPEKEKLYETAIRAAKVLGCHGYTGVDIIQGEDNYVIDVNPRPTTSLVSISKVMQEEIAGLLLNNVHSQLPESVNINGVYSFTKEELV